MILEGENRNTRYLYRRLMNERMNALAGILSLPKWSVRFMTITM